MAARFGGKWLFGIGILCTSVFSLLIPFGARAGWQWMLVFRIIQVRSFLVPAISIRGHQVVHRKSACSHMILQDIRLQLENRLWILALLYKYHCFVKKKRKDLYCSRTTSTWITKVSTYESRKCLILCCHMYIPWD